MCSFSAASGMVLTAAGQSLLPEGLESGHGGRRACPVTPRHSPARSRAAPGSARFRDPEFLRLGDFLAQALERYPLVEIELRHAVSGAAFAQVRDGAFDASFYYGNLTHPSVEAVPLRRIGYRVVAPVAWRWPVSKAPTGTTSPRWRGS